MQKRISLVNIWRILRIDWYVYDMYWDERGGWVIFYWGGDARKNARRIIALIDKLERF